MKKQKANTTFWISALLTSLLHIGCATSPTPRFYLLRPDTTGRPQVPADAPAVVVRPVEITGYLDRPQIVIRKDRREIAQSQFDRWAEPLDKQIGIYISEVLAQELTNFNVKYFILHDGNGSRYEVETVIVSLDGVPGEEVKLNAKWRILTTGKEGRIIMDETAQLTSPCPEPGIPGIVAATEELLNELSNRIAAALKRRP